MKVIEVAMYNGDFYFKLGYQKYLTIKFDKNEQFLHCIDRYPIIFDKNVLK